MVNYNVSAAFFLMGSASSNMSWISSVTAALQSDLGLGWGFCSRAGIALNGVSFFNWRRHFYLNAALDQGQIYSCLCKTEFAMNQQEINGCVNTNKFNSTGEFF